MVFSLSQDTSFDVLLLFDRMLNPFIGSLNHQSNFSIATSPASKAFRHQGIAWERCSGG